MTKLAALAMMLFNAIMSMPHSHAPGETTEERVERYHLIAEANAKAGLAYANGKGWTAWELALAVTVLQGNESGGFDKRVHAGEEHPVYTQDKGLAKCMGQIHETKDQKGNPWGPVPRQVWEKLAGLDVDSTELCARVTAQLLVSYAGQCGVFLGTRANRNVIAQTFASYGSGGKCVPGDREWKRADQWVALSAKYGPRPDLPGYHRVPLVKLPEEVRLAAKDVLYTIHTDEKPGKVFFTFGGLYGIPDDKYRYRLEHHAEGKIGI